MLKKEVKLLDGPLSCLSENVNFTQLAVGGRNGENSGILKIVLNIKKYFYNFFITLCYKMLINTHKFSFQDI